MAEEIIMKEENALVATEEQPKDEKPLSLDDMVPAQIVAELDKYVTYLHVETTGAERLVLRLAVQRRELQSRAVLHERERLHRDKSVWIPEVVSARIPLD